MVDFHRLTVPYFKVELFTNPGKVTFHVLQLRLISFVNTRINNGDFSERALAKILGISQPQIHNVLKGARKLRPELADRMIRKFGMSILDLLEPNEIYEEMLSRGAIEVGGAVVSAPVGSHVPPKRFDSAGLLKKPSRSEASSMKARAGKAS